MEDEWKKLFKPCASQRLFLPVSKRNNLLINAIDFNLSNFEFSVSIAGY